jgi:hypothetical protein
MERPRGPLEQRRRRLQWRGASVPRLATGRSPTREGAGASSFAGGAQARAGRVVARQVLLLRDRSQDRPSGNRAKIRIRRSGRSCAVTRRVGADEDGAGSLNGGDTRPEKPTALGSHILFLRERLSLHSGGRMRRPPRPNPAACSPSGRTTASGRAPLSFRSTRAPIAQRAQAAAVRCPRRAFGRDPNAVPPGRPDARPVPIDDRPFREYAVPDCPLPLRFSFAALRITSDFILYFRPTGEQTLAGGWRTAVR